MGKTFYTDPSVEMTAQPMDFWHPGWREAHSSAKDQPEVKPTTVLSMWALERDSSGFESGLCHLSVVGSWVAHVDKGS